MRRPQLSCRLTHFTARTRWNVRRVTDLLKPGPDALARFAGHGPAWARMQLGESAAAEAGRLLAPELDSGVISTMFTEEREKLSSGQSEPRRMMSRPMS